MANPADRVVPTALEWEEWRQMPATRAWLEMLRRQREFLKEQLATGAVGTEQFLAVVSKCRDFQQLVEMDYDSFYAFYTGEAWNRDLKAPAPGRESEWPTAGRPRDLTHPV